MDNIFVPYSFKKHGIYYFVRRIPTDLADQYENRKVSYSLRTKSPKLAAKRALIAAAQLDDYWDKLRDDENRVPTQHFIATDPARRDSLTSGYNNLGPTVSDATELYLRLKGNNRPSTFTAGARRACNYLIEVSGNKCHSISRCSF